MHVLSHLDYGDVIYHNSRTDLMDLIERVQYKAVLIVSGCWQGTSRTKLYDELGWECLSDRRWVRRLTIFYKIQNGLAPFCLLISLLETKYACHFETGTTMHFLQLEQKGKQTVFSHPLLKNGKI